MIKIRDIRPQAMRAWLLVMLYGLALAVSCYLTAENTRRQLVAQTSIHAQDTATSIGISLSPYIQRREFAGVAAVVDANFDHGYYERIEVTAKDGSELCTRAQSINVAGVPKWFIRIFPIDGLAGSAQLVDGWRPVGQVNVLSHPAHAYALLWQSTMTSLCWYLFWAVGSMTVTFAMRNQCKPASRDTSQKAITHAHVLL